MFGKVFGVFQEYFVVVQELFVVFADMGLRINAIRYYLFVDAQRTI